MNDRLTPRTPGYLTEDEEGEHGPLSRRFARGESLIPLKAVHAEDNNDASDTIRISRKELKLALQRAMSKK